MNENGENKLLDTREKSDNMKAITNLMIGEIVLQWMLKELE